MDKITGRCEDEMALPSKKKERVIELKGSWFEIYGILGSFLYPFRHRKVRIIVEEINAVAKIEPHDKTGEEITREFLQERDAFGQIQFSFGEMHKVIDSKMIG